MRNVAVKGGTVFLIWFLAPRLLPLVQCASTFAPQRKGFVTVFISSVVTMTLSSST